MLEKLISRYDLFLSIGILISLSGLHLGTIRYNNEKTPSQERFEGRDNSEAFNRALKAEIILAHSIEQWLFVGLAFLKLETGTQNQAALKSIDEKVPIIEVPFIARVFFVGWVSARRLIVADGIKAGVQIVKVIEKR